MKALALMVLVSATAAPQQFDLICSGTKETISTLIPSGPEPYTTHYRVDLARKKWCEGECKDPAPIVRVSQTVIIFKESQVEDGMGGMLKMLEFVNRETGKHVASDDDGSNFYTSYHGQCERRPFSGFPKIKTKF